MKTPMSYEGLVDCSYYGQLSRRSQSPGMTAPAAPNVHILGFLSERVVDIRNLNELLLVRENDEVSTACRTRNALKRKRAMISSKRRTASQKRYKLPRMKIRTKKKRKLLSSVEGNQPRCRQESRNRSIMMKLHSIPALESYQTTDVERLDATNERLTTRWLETHYWHRKRFLMKSCWGYCLPFHHKARGKKFLHSAVAHSAVIHDSSYIRPIEIIGYPSMIAELLKQFTVSFDVSAILLNEVHS
jgi:Ribonucleases P/MRP protein subunit POP1